VYKLAIIVPYRDRSEQLQKFIDYIGKYLDNRDFKYFIIVVEQNDEKLFNRGKLLNIGFQEAKAKRCDYVVFHDVDMLPIKVDYSYSEIPLHLASDNLPFEHYFGGITLFPVDLFEKINGFSNRYWGWGFEDDDLRYRCISNHISLNQLSTSSTFNPRTNLKLNGANAYISLANPINVNDSFTIDLKFIPEEGFFNKNNQVDKFTLFSIPGYDFSINYTSFNRYQVEFFDEDLNYHHIYSDIEIVKPFPINISVTYNKKEEQLKFYFNHNLIGEIEGFSNFYNYNDETKVYLGCSKGKENFFKGSIESFAVWSQCLEEKEIQSIHSNRFFSLTQDFNYYKKSYSLKLFYDTKFISKYSLIDLAGNKPGTIIKCEIVKTPLKERFIDYIPYRRPSKIKHLHHENNGFVDGQWKNQATRWNQLRFNNEVKPGFTDTKVDGLSDLTFKLFSKNSQSKVIYLKVGL